jgi:hypothetical protein
LTDVNIFSSIIYFVVCCRRAAAEAATFNPCETESLSAAYNSCAYHPPPPQRYQNQNPMVSRTVMQHGSMAVDDRRYRTVCYPASSAGAILPPNPPMSLPPPLDDYDPKCGGGSAGDFGKFFVTGGSGAGFGGPHLYESAHFDTIPAVGGGVPMPMTASTMSGSAAASMHQQAEMASPHGHRLLTSA